MNRLDGEPGGFSGHLPQQPALTDGPVLIIGTGLLGASIGLTLSGRGVDVYLRDQSSAALAIARDVGAGRAEAPEVQPTLVVVATPPDTTDEIVANVLLEFEQAVVTDVASVKSVVLSALQANPSLEPVHLQRYVGSHPMAGGERSGAIAADADLFIGRPWVISAHPGSAHQATSAIRNLALDVEALPVAMSAEEHDRAVALVSHVPQVLASLVAARLIGGGPAALSLAGQGLRDVTRIAASNPSLWAAILAGNAAAVRDQLRLVAADLHELEVALDRADQDGPLAPGAIATLAQHIAAGNEGVARIPGKHGGVPKLYREVVVLIPDTAGELGRLFSEIGEIGVNIEDFRMEHSPGQKVGMGYVSIRPSETDRLVEALEMRDWRVVVGPVN